MYVVLLTVAADGSSLIDLPTAQRVVGSNENYTAALAAARELRVAYYLHDRTGEVRVITEGESTGCAWTNPTLFQWLGGATLLHCGSYALAMEDTDLVHYEPQAA